MKIKYRIEMVSGREIELRDEMMEALVNGDIDLVEKDIQNGYQLNQRIKLALNDGCPKTMPIMIAVLAKNIEMVDLLVRYGAKLDMGKEHAVLYACQTCEEEMIRHIASLGAKVNVWDARGFNEYGHILSYFENSWEKQKVLFELLEELGVDVVKAGGAALRDSIKNLSPYLEKYGLEESEKIWYRHAIDYMLSKHVDVDYAVVDEVFAQRNQTALGTAVYDGYLEGVKLLVEHGADITIEGPEGRPYVVACQRGFKEIADYLREHEDPKLHDEAYLTALALERNMPQALIDFLKTDNPELEDTTEEHEIEYVRFLHFQELYEYRVKRTDYVVLTNEIDDYVKYLLWHPTKKKICYYDPEMEDFGELAGYEKFWADPFGYLDRMM